MSDDNKTQQTTDSAAADQSWAAQVIDLFGGPQKMAVTLDMAPSTIAKWREKGEIPEGRLKEIFDGAKALDLALPPHPGLASGEDVRIAAHSRKPDDVENILEDELPDPSSGVGFAVITSMVALVGVLTVPLWHGAYLDKLGTGNPAREALDQVAELQQKIEEQAKEIESLEKKLPKPNTTPQYVRNLESRVDSLQTQMSNVQTTSNNNRNNLNNLERRVDTLFNYRAANAAGTTYVPATATAGYDDGTDGNAMPDTMAGAAADGTTEVGTYTPPPIPVAVAPAPVVGTAPQVIQSGLSETSIIAVNQRIDALRDRIEDIDDQADDALDQISDILVMIKDNEANQQKIIEDMIRSLEAGDARVSEGYMGADAEIHRQLGEVQGQLDAKILVQMNQLRDERVEQTAALGKAMRRVEEQVAALAGRVDQAENNVAGDLTALRATLEDVKETRVDGHALVIALNQLRARTQTTTPFNDELVAAQAVAAEMPEVKQSLEELSALSKSGVPTHEVLTERFKKIAPLLVQGRARGDSDGIVGDIFTSLASAISFRPASDGKELPENASFQQIISYAEARLEAGDLKTAHEVMGNVIPKLCDPATQVDNECPPEAAEPAWVNEVKKHLNPWLQAAGARLKLDRVMTEVSKAGLARASR